MFIAKYNKFFIGLSAAVVMLAAFSMWRYGINLGMDFVGGSIMEVEYASSTPDVATIKEAIKPLGLGETIQPYGEKGVIIKARDLKEEDRAKLVSALAVGGVQVTEKRFNSVGPTIGKELRTKSVYAIILVVLCIALFISFAFRHISGVVRSWEYGIATIISLAHDVVVPVGLFAYLGAHYGVEIDALFVTAVLTILGFSVHDTIVVFDRVRENLKLKKSKSFEETVGMSIKQTLSRSINTSMTTIFTLIAILAVGSESVRFFALALIVGIVAGTYSSIMLASPLLVFIHDTKKK